MNSTDRGTVRRQILDYSKVRAILRKSAYSAHCDNKEFRATPGITVQHLIQSVIAATSMSTRARIRVVNGTPWFVQPGKAHMSWVNDGASQSGFRPLVNRPWIPDPDATKGQCTLLCFKEQEESVAKQEAK